MKNETKHKYFQVPLCLLQKIHTEQEYGYNLILAYGLINYAKKIKCAEFDVARQLIYDYYNAKDKIENGLYKNLQKYMDEGAISFAADNSVYREYKDFFPEDNVLELQKVFIQNTELMKKAILHYQVHCIKSYSENKFDSMNAIIDRYEMAKELVDEHEAKYGRDAQAGVKIDTLFEFKGKENKRENEILCGYIAIKSLIGEKDSVATHKNVILMRMIGAKSNDVLHEFLKQRKLNTVYEKYSKRYHVDKLIEKLVGRKFVQTKISFGRQIFFSKKLNTLDLSFVIKEKLEKKYSKKIQEKEARQDIKKYLDELKNGAGQ